MQNEREVQQETKLQLESLKVEHQQTTYEAQRKIYELEKHLECTQAELTVEGSLHALLEEKYNSEKANWNKERQEAELQAQQLNDQLAQAHQTITSCNSTIS